MAEKSFFEIMAEETPNVNNAFFGLAHALETEGGLDPKTFQLVYLAIQAANCQVDSVCAHAGFAKKAGATREEVRGAIEVTLFTHGIRGVAAVLAPALEAYDKA